MSGVTMSNKVRTVFVNLLTHRDKALLTRKKRGALPDVLVVVCDSANQKMGVRQAIGRDVRALMEAHYRLNDPIVIAAQMIDMCKEMGIHYNLTTDAKVKHVDIPEAAKLQEVVDTPELWISRKEPVTTVTGGRVVREVAVRTGQSDFKHRVNMNFGSRCAISGHNTGELLQACHIQPFAVAQNNSTSNGILMDVGLHVLFDRDLMCINPDTMTVHFKSGLVHPYVALYEGVVINKSKVALNYEFLKVRWNMFK